MLYSFIIIQDRRGEPLGLNLVHTQTGSVLILFSDQSKLADFQRYVEKTLAEEGKGNEQAIATIDVSTADEFKRWVARSDPGLADSVEFLLDSDPDASEIIQIIREMQGDQ